MEMNGHITTVRQGIAIVVGSFLLGMAVNFFNPGGFRFISLDALVDSGIVKIGVEEAKIKFDHSSALFIDTRDGEDYSESRIAGAISVPGYPESLSVNKIREQFNVISLPLEAVLYCEAGCDSAELIGRRLLEMGYKRKVYILHRGIGAWEEKKYPMEKGQKAGRR